MRGWSMFSPAQKQGTENAKLDPATAVATPDRAAGLPKTHRTSKNPTGLMSLIWLNAEVGTGGGDVAGGADFAPIDIEKELLDTFESEIAAADADYRKVMKEDLPAFNRSLVENNVTSLAAVSN